MLLLDGHSPTVALPSLVEASLPLRCFQIIKKWTYWIQAPDTYIQSSHNHSIYNLDYVSTLWIIVLYGNGMIGIIGMIWFIGVPMLWSVDCGMRARYFFLTYLVLQRNNMIWDYFTYGGCLSIKNS